jgi:hypothetical protein
MATDELDHGIPVFLDQLIETLAREQTAGSIPRTVTAENGRGELTSDLGVTAARHGGDLFDAGFTIEQVVRDYGDVCQAVTDLALECGAPIAVAEFRTFNRCLDIAIAGAVTEYAKHGSTRTGHDPENSNSRTGPLAHELRKQLDTAMLVVAAFKGGNVGVGGPTAAVLDRSLMAMRSLIDREIVAARVTSGLPPRLQPIRLAGFLREIEAAASLDALARGCRFSVATVGEEVQIDADREMLSAALGNLLHNAFKYTGLHTEVWLRGIATKDKVTIEVEDHCGGLSESAYDKLLLPFVQSGRELGLGLDIFRRSIEALHGALTVRDVPGSGCVFSIELPRHNVALELIGSDPLGVPVLYTPKTHSQLQHDSDRGSVLGVTDRVENLGP